MLEQDAETARTIRALQALVEKTSVTDDLRLPPERELALTLGVSRRQLRLALDVLERKDIIFRRRGQGTFAAPPPLADAGRYRTLAASVTPDQIMDVRLQIEPYLAQLAAEHITPQSAEQLRVLMQNSCETQTAAAYDLADETFHYRIAELAENPLFLEIYQLIRQLRKESGWRERRAETNVPSFLKATAAQHRAIYSAIAEGDGLQADAAVRVHLEYVADAIAEKTGGKRAQI